MNWNPDEDMSAVGNRSYSRGNCKCEIENFKIERAKMKNPGRLLGFFILIRRRPILPHRVQALLAPAHYHQRTVVSYQQSLGSKNQAAGGRETEN